MRTRVLPSPSAVAVAAADHVTSAAAERPDLTVALPTGRTPVPLYDELAERYARGWNGLAQVRGFNLDELVLPAGDPRTFRAFMERHAWGHTGLQRERCEIPNGAARDLEAECRRYENAIAAAGGLDLAVLGVGADGHVAYNMPGLITLPTHVVRLPDGLAASLGVPEEDWPLRAVTMGIGTIRQVRRIVVMAMGETKATAVRALVHGPEDPEWPCSFLGGHPDIEVVLDPAAAARL